MNRDHLRRLRDVAEAAGFQLVRSKRHLIWRHPSGAQVTTAATPSDHRALQQARSLFRRALAATH